MTKKRTIQEVQNKIDKVQNGRIKIISKYIDNKTPVQVKCIICGLKWTSSVTSLNRRPVGVNCKHYIKQTLSDIQNKVDKMQNGRIQIIGKYTNRNKHTLVKCNICGLEWKTNIASLLRRPIGVSCNHHIKKSLPQVQKEIDKVQDNRIKIIGHFQGTHTKTLVRCLDCGLEWETTAHDLTRKKIGINCNHHIKLNDKMVQKRILNASNGKITMIGKYNGAKTKTLMKCNICGYKWNTQPYVSYKGFGCPKCSNSIPITTTEFKNRVKNICGNKYLVLGKVLYNHDSKVLIKHNIRECGKTFKRSPHHFLSNPRCPFEIRKEMSISQSIPLNIAKKRLFTSRKDEFKIVKGYKNMTSKCWIEHSKCKRHFQGLVGSIITHNSGCPFCYSSNGEDATRNYLIRYKYTFKEQYRIDKCKYKRTLPFDFAVFKNNKLIFLIEYQGIQHTSPKFGKKEFKLTNKRDYIKYNYCLNNNIPLIRIPYKRWYGRFNQLQSQVNKYLDKKINEIKF